MTTVFQTWTVRKLCPCGGTNLIMACRSDFLFPTQPSGLISLPVRSSSMFSWRYPMALGGVADLEEVAPTPDRPPAEEVFNEAIRLNKEVYNNHHVYPHTYRAGFYYKQKNYLKAIQLMLLESKSSHLPNCTVCSNIAPCTQLISWVGWCRKSTNQISA